MKAVVIGPGRIGCGFAGQLLRASGFEVVFVGRSSAERLSRAGRYLVRLTDGRHTEEHVVDGIRAVSATQPGRVAAEIREAGLIITAVGAPNLPAVARLIALGLKRRARPVNVLAFENLANAGDYLRVLVARELPASFHLDRHGICSVLVDRVVNRPPSNSNNDELPVFIGERQDMFAVDASGVRAPLPDVRGMVLAENYQAWEQRKLYIFSAGHATCAYLGFLKGYRHIYAAIRDTEIRAAVLAAMREGQRGVAVLYGEEFAGGEDDLRRTIARFENAALDDLIVRVGRDPQRKLSANDRLVGAARLAEQAGVRPDKLALAAAAALCFNNENDPSALTLQQQIEQAGVNGALKGVCGLNPTQGVGHDVADIREWLAAGSQRGNSLVSLERGLWNWRA